MFSILKSKPNAKLKKISLEQVNYFDKIIEFKLYRSKRKTVSISVYPNQNVKVKAPNRASITYIKNCVEKKSAWILEKQKHFQKTIKPKNDNNFNYLGVEYQLKTQLGLINFVSIENNFLCVSATSLNKRKIEKLIASWYKKSAEDLFLERLAICKKLVAPLNISYNGNLQFRNMRSRWGSCSRHAEIKLNYELIKTPLECIDYVIVHELCHIKEFNHSPKFYSLLDKIMPDWKKRKELLKNFSTQNYSE